MPMNNTLNFETMVPFMPKDPMYANCYVPYQSYEQMYEPNISLDRGTVFPELYMPYDSKYEK